MRDRRFSLTLFTVLALSPALTAADQAGPSPRLLPHPEILQLPDPAPGAASAPAAVPAVVEPSPLAVPPTSREDKEIAPRGGASRTTATTFDAKGTELPQRIGSSGWSFLRDVWPLMAVLLLIGGMAFILKKFMPARGLLAGSEALKIVARTHVAPKQQVVLVKLGRRLVLIGVSPERMSALSSIDDPDQVAMLLGEIASRQPNSMTGAFASSMARERETYADEPLATDDTEVTHGQVRGFLRKVRALAGKNAVE